MVYGVQYICTYCDRVNWLGDMNCQSQVTRHTRAQDPDSVHTLGLITKPNTLDIGSEIKQFYLELAKNKDAKFKLGWLPTVA